ncbi:MAG: N-acetylmuramoyl-L-alanine amidase [Verrucomicrobiia bacterium]
MRYQYLPRRHNYFALFLVFGLTLAHATQQKFEAVHLDGQNYVPLADWARANDLKWFWFEGDKKVEVTNHAIRLVLEANSDQAEVNGVRVRLSFPFAVEKAIPLIAQLDLDTAVDPLLFPPHFSDFKPIKMICLDPGHGGKDSGNRVGWHDEKNYTLPLALELREQLGKAGFNVILTRTTDKYVTLSDRAAFANRHDADLFVSLHFNATPTGRDEAEGPETYCITPVGATSSDEYVERSETGPAVGVGPTVGNRNEQKSLLLAYQVQKSLVEDLSASDRGVKRARFAVLRDTAMPAILIEGGFMSNPVESKKIYSAAYRRRVAEAIVKGIRDYERRRYNGWNCRS